MIIQTKCGCGCGGVVFHEKFAPWRIKQQGKIRFIAGHQNIGRKHTEENKKACARPMMLNGRWKGGRMIDQDGYALVKSWGHPDARKNGYVLEHRLVMEKHLERPLKEKEVVHHVNSIRSDNRIENLVLCKNAAEHMQVDRTGKKYPRHNEIWFTCEKCSNKFCRTAYWKNKTVRWCSWECRYSK